MAITLQTLVNGDTAYISKHNSNYSLIETNINSLLSSISAIPAVVGFINHLNAVYGDTTAPTRMDENTCLGSINADSVDITSGYAFLPGAGSVAYNPSTSGVNLVGEPDGGPYYIGLNSITGLPEQKSSATDALYSVLKTAGVLNTLTNLAGNSFENRIPLTISDASVPVTVVRKSATTTSELPALNVDHTTTGDAADGLGASINFRFTDTGVTDQDLGRIGFTRNGADDQGKFTISPVTGGSPSIRMVITHDGNVGIGVTDPTIGFHYANDPGDGVQRIAFFQNLNADANDDGFISIGSGVGGGGNDGLAIGYNEASNYGWLVVHGENPGDGLNVTDGGAIGIGVSTLDASAQLHVRNTQNSTTAILLDNLDAGAGAQTDIQVKNDAGSLAQMGINSSGYTPYGALVANSAFLYSTSSAGLTIMGDHASADIRFAPGGNTTKIEFAAAGDATFHYDNVIAANTVGLVLLNSTAATVGVPQQFSAMLNMSGAAWETTGGTSQTCEFAMRARPVNGATAEVVLDFLSQINGGGWDNVVNYNSNGVIATGNGTFDAGIEVGSLGSGNRNAYFDLHAEDSVDYNFRVIRSSGTNGIANIRHTGTGDFTIVSEDAAKIQFATNGTNALIVETNQDLEFAGSNIDINRSGTGVAQRLRFQTAGVNDWFFQNEQAASSNLELHDNNNVRLYYLNGGGIALGSGEQSTTSATGYTLRAPDLATGGAGDLAGADITVRPGLGTGTGDVGQIIFQTVDEAAAGDNIQTVHSATMILDDNRVAIGAEAFGATLDVTQSDASAAIPVMELDQDDVDEPFINFVGTAGSGNSIDTRTTSGAVTHHLLFQINGSSFWVPGSTTAPS